MKEGVGGGDLEGGGREKQKPDLQAKGSEKKSVFNLSTISLKTYLRYF